MLLSEGCSSYVGINNLFSDLSISNPLARVLETLFSVVWRQSYYIARFPSNL